MPEVVQKEIDVDRQKVRLDGCPSLPYSPNESRVTECFVPFIACYVRCKMQNEMNRTDGKQLEITDVIFSNYRRKFGPLVSDLGNL